MEIIIVILIAVATIATLIGAYFTPSIFRKIMAEKKRKEVKRFLRDAKLLLHNLPNESVQVKNPLYQLRHFLTRLYPLYFQIRQLQNFAEYAKDSDFPKLEKDLVSLVIALERVFTRHTKLGFPPTGIPVDGDMSSLAWLYVSEADELYFLDLPPKEIHIELSGKIFELSDIFNREQALKENGCSQWGALSQVARDTLEEFGVKIPQYVSHAYQLAQ